MELNQIKKGVRVEDKGFPELGAGTIIMVLTKTIKICFDNIATIRTYDFPHAKMFLTIVKPNGNKKKKKKNKNVSKKDADKKRKKNKEKREYATYLRLKKKFEKK